MKDRFEGIRAERDEPHFQAAAPSSNQHAGLWKQIALGIVVGYSALAVIGLLAWVAAGKLLMSNLGFAVP
jgi:hypothetical protein